MTYRLIIFDFDGTLADSARWFVETLNELAPRHGFQPVTEAEAEMLRGFGTAEIIAHLGVARWRMPFIAAAFRRRAARDIARIRLFDDVDAVLATLHHSGAVLAVVSSNAESNVRHVLGPETAALVAHFDCGAGLFDKARRFRRLIRRTGMSPADTLCIGDEQRDMHAAHAVGAAAGAVLWGYATRDMLLSCRPTLTFEHPRDITAALCVPECTTSES